MQLFADALRRQRVLAAIERLEHLQAGLNQTPVGEHAAVAGEPLIGMHRDDRVDRVFGPDLGRPSALRAFAEQGRGGDARNAKRRQSRLAGRHRVLRSYGLPRCVRRLAMIAS
jgi:hypothetical protein